MNEYETLETVVAIPINKLVVDDTFNCRGKIKPVDVIDLANSIERNGLIQPIVVMNIENTGTYKIMAGYRRHMAFTVLKRTTVPCIIKSKMDEKAQRIINLTENMGRKDLNLMQEAHAILPLIEFGMTQEELVRAIPGTSRGWIQVRVMLLKMPAAIQEEAAAGIINQIDIRDLMTLKLQNPNNLDVLYETVKRIKEAKLLGKKKRIKTFETKKPAAKAKHIRRRPEMFAMMEHIVQSLDTTTLASRTLAWAAGEISDEALFISINYECKQRNIEYFIPEMAI